jgi:hypothetical protein
MLVWCGESKEHLTGIHAGGCYRIDETHLFPDAQGGDYCWENSCLPVDTLVKVIEYTEYRSEGPAPVSPPDHPENPLFLTVQVVQALN